MSIPRTPLTKCIKGLVKVFYIPRSLLWIAEKLHSGSSNIFICYVGLRDWSCQHDLVINLALLFILKPPNIGIKPNKVDIRGPTIWQLYNIWFSSLSIIRSLILSKKKKNVVGFWRCGFLGQAMELSRILILIRSLQALSLAYTVF